MDSHYEPSPEERSQLAQIVDLPGFAVFQKIAVAAQAEFREALFALNPQADDYEAQALTLLRRAEVAQTVWEAIARRVEHAMELLNQPKTKGTAPTLEEALPDITEETL